MRADVDHWTQRCGGSHHALRSRHAHVNYPSSKISLHAPLNKKRAEIERLLFPNLHVLVSHTRTPAFLSLPWAQWYFSSNKIEPVLKRWVQWLWDVTGDQSSVASSQVRRFTAVVKTYSRELKAYSGLHGHFHSWAQNHTWMHINK